MEMKSKNIHRSCSCGKSCLGPLTFHPNAKGQLVTLSEGGRRATRGLSSFRYGLVFSSRPLRLGEKVHLRVERSMTAWHGAIRLGFTNVMPGSKPLPSLAIPELTSSQGYWATPIPEQHCSPRTELTFWVASGCLHVHSNNGYKHSVQMTQMNSNKPIWAMIDVYGQTNTILLLGSEKRGLLCKRHSCLTTKINPTDKNCGYDGIPTEIQEKIKRRNSVEERIVNDIRTLSNTDDEENCVVCFSGPSTVILKCGHHCLCNQCALRVIHEFGTCPLCRQCIRSF